MIRIRVKESEEQLKGLLKTEKDPKKRERIQMLYFMKTDQANEIKDLVNLLVRHRNTISDWLESYKKKGLQNLLEIGKPPGRTPLIDNEARELLKQELENPNGFNSHWEIKDWLKAKFDLDVSYKVVQSTVKNKLNSKPKVVRPSNVKKDKEAEQAFKKNFLKN